MIENDRAAPACWRASTIALAALRPVASANARPTKAEFVRRACAIQVAGDTASSLAAGQAAKPGTSASVSSSRSGRADRRRSP